MKYIRCAAKVLALALVPTLLSFRSTVFAQSDQVWSNPLGGNYSASSNWLSGILPGSDDTLIFDLGSTNRYTVRASGANLAYRLLLRNDRLLFDAGGGQLNLGHNDSSPTFFSDATGQQADFIFTNGMLISGRTMIAPTPGSSAHVVVDGTNSSWVISPTTGHALFVGSSGGGGSGTGRLSIIGGAQLVQPAGGSETDIYISGNSGAEGILEVVGAGSRVVSAGALNLGWTGPGTLLLTNGGAVSVGSSALLLSNTLAVTEGFLSGSGTVHGDVVIAQGVLSPSTWALTFGIADEYTNRTVVVDGNFTQQAGGFFEVTIGDNNPAANTRLVVTKQAHLGGALIVQFAPGYVPHDGDVYQLLSGGSIVGTFDSILLPELPLRFRFDTANLYTAGEVRFLDAGVHWINPLGGAWETPGNWELSQAPEAAQLPIFDQPATYTVTLSGDAAVASLAVPVGQPALNLQGHTLTLSDGHKGLDLPAADGSAASLTVTNGQLHWDADYINIGRFAGSTGALWLNATGTLSVGGSIFLLADSFSPSNSAELFLGPGLDVSLGGELGVLGDSPGAAQGPAGEIRIHGATVTSDFAAFIDGGLLSIQNGGRLTLLGTSVSGAPGSLGALQVGSAGNATILVSGAGTMIDARGAINLGRSKTSSSLVVGNGASVSSQPVTNSSSFDPVVSGTIGRGANASGMAMITDIGSVWRQTGTLVVGYSGSGSLVIMNVGRVESAGGMIAHEAGSSGHVNLLDGGSQWIVTNSLWVGGNDVASGGAGTLFLDRYTTVSVGTKLQVWTNGILSGAGTIVGNLVSAGGTISTGPGPGPLSVEGNFTQDSGVLSIYLSGSGPGQFGRVQVSGSVTLNGLLAVTLANGFTPVWGDEFQLLACSSLTGTFSTVSLPTDFSLAYGSGGVFLTYLPAAAPRVLLDGQPIGGVSAIVTNAALLSFDSPRADTPIYYTLDGSFPGSGLPFTGPLLLNQEAVIQAIAYTADYSYAAQSVAVHVTVVHSPAILAAPPAQIVAVAGRPVRLAIEANGTPPLGYQWYFEGALLAGANGPALVFPTVQPAQAGHYVAVITNAYGAVTSAPSLLGVLTPPSILEQPAGTNVNSGVTVVFCVSVLGTEPITFQWRKNGVNIPGATHSCLTVSNVAAASAGAYSVVVANGADAITSAEAVLRLSDLAVTPTAQDQFVARNPLTPAGGSVAANNLGATLEPNEPTHAARSGGASVWYRWTPTASGIATFRTSGSAFDTLLAVYVGTSLGTLTAVGADDDSGGFLTSEVRFNATAGTEYAIAIDGLAGAQGAVILTWNLEVTPQVLPLLSTRPQSLTVPAGGTAVLSVTNSDPDVTYQWYFNGTRLNGATGAALILTNVQVAQVGAYAVAVTNLAGRGLLTDPATLEIGPFANVRSQDKVEELLGGGFQGFSATASPGASVSIGSLGTQMLNTTNSTTSFRETNHCGIIGGASRWFKLRPAADATLAIDTQGSAFDTVLAVYTGDTLLAGYPTHLITCNDNANANAGVRSSRVVFPATAGVDYLIAIDGVGSSAGLVVLNWALGQPPTTNILNSPVASLVREGQPLLLTAPTVAAIPSPGFQWWLNTLPILAGTNATLRIEAVNAANAGTYSVVTSNALGSATSIVARVTLEIPLTVQVHKVMQNDEPRFQLDGTASRGFFVQATTNWLNWIPLFTNATGTLPILFDDLSTTNRPLRFYRALPWP